MFGAPKALPCRTAMRNETLEIDLEDFWNRNTICRGKRLAAYKGRAQQTGWLVRGGHPDQVVRIGIVELIARALVKHVRIEAIGAKQRDTMLAVGPLPLQPRELRCQRNDLLVEFEPRVQPILTGIGVDPEIADQRRRHRVEGKPGQERFQSRTRDHARSMRWSG